MFGFLKKKYDENTIIHNVYQKMNQSMVRDLFYGGEENASIILRPLWKILFPSSGRMSQKEAEATAFFYTQVWIRKHGNMISVGSNTNYIKDMLEKRFPEYTRDAVSEGVDCCVDFLYDQEPTLKEEDENFIVETRFKNRDEDGNPILARGKQVPEGYVSIDEVAREDPYMALAITATMLFEEKRYPEAISVFEKCILMKPENTHAWFEKAEAQIRIHDYRGAMDTLRKTADYVRKDTERARLYRRIGFILIEEREYDDAIACMQYSLQFEKNDRALGELQYINSLTGKKDLPGGENAREYLQRKGLLLTT